jgi:sugar lactone lactonase YvrE
MIDPSGNVVRTFGESASMSFPNGVSVDKDGNVYVTDSNNGRLLVFTPDGTLVTQVGRGVGEGNLGLPRGVAVSDDGKVYIADSTGQSVFVYATYKPGDTRLEFLGSFGAGGVSNGTFQFPNGLTLDARGRVYVADAGNDRVQVWSY